MNPILLNINNAQIAILRVDEIQLNIPQKDFPEKPHSLKRLTEKEGIRFLNTHYLNDFTILYNNNGKPYLKEGGFVSISHSKSFVGLAWSFDFNIGFDIEEVHPRINKVESKFIHPEEMNSISSLRDKTIIWSIKESIVKITDNKQLDFKNDIRTMKMNSENWSGVVLKHNLIFNFSIIEIDNNVICINTI